MLRYSFWQHREVSLDDAIHCFVHANRCVSEAFYPDQDGILNGPLEILFVTTSGVKGVCPLEPFGVRIRITTGSCAGLRYIHSTVSWRVVILLKQCFSKFVRPRPGKFFFRKTRARSQQIY